MVKSKPEKEESQAGACPPLLYIYKPNRSRSRNFSFLFLKQRKLKLAMTGGDRRRQERGEQGPSAKVVRTERQQVESYYIPPVFVVTTCNPVTCRAKLKGDGCGLQDLSSGSMGSYPSGSLKRKEKKK